MCRAKAVRFRGILRKLETIPKGSQPVTSACQCTAIVKEADMMTCSQRVDGWTLVLRRQPVRIVQGQPEGGYTDVFELICCDCGDDPNQEYREVSPRLKLVRGPY